MRFAHTWKMYDRIPMKTKSILPDEGFGSRMVDISGSDTVMYQRPVYCLPKPNKGYAKHRVMVICECGTHVPFGRMHQHYGKPTCLEAQKTDKWEADNYATGQCGNAW